MAAAYFRVIFPGGSGYVHGGNKSEIRDSVDDFLEKHLPPGTIIEFFWGSSRKCKKVIRYTRRGYVVISAREFEI